MYNATVAERSISSVGRSLGRRPIRARASAWATAMARWLARLGVVPDQISIASIGFALIAAGALIAAARCEGLARVVLLIATVPAIGLRLLANMLDGLVAVEHDRRSPTGELFNEVPDRISDCVTLVAAGVAAGGSWGVALGWTAAILAVLTAYVRTLGAALGSPALFLGPMAKAHRMALLALACVLGAAEAAMELPPRALLAALGLMSVGCTITCARRLRRIATDLRNRAAVAEGGASNVETYERLCAPLPAWSPRRLYFAALRLLLGTVGRLSTGVAIGWRYGFDSGPSLDHVYRNTASGTGWLGRGLDRIYLNAPGWRGIRQRRENLDRTLREVVGRLQQAGQPVRILDVACGGGRYVLDVLRDLPPSVASAELRDWDPAALETARRMAADMGVSQVRFRHASGFDRTAIATAEPRPTLAVVSGFYELFADNALLELSLAGLHDALADGGYLIYTNQPWHPQLELVARTLTNRDGAPWVMRCRCQEEMDGLVERAGFEVVVRRADEQGMYTVSIARKVAAGAGR